MNFLVILAVVLAVSLCVEGRPEEKALSSRLSSVNVDELLHNERLLERYVNCLLGTSKCNAEGSELKKLLPGAMEDHCSQCSQKEKDNIKKVLKYVMFDQPKYWNQLKGIYDPEGVFEKRFKKECEEADKNDEKKE